MISILNPKTYRFSSLIIFILIIGLFISSCKHKNSESLRSVKEFYQKEIFFPRDSIIITNNYLNIICLGSKKSNDTIIVLDDVLAQKYLHYPKIYNNSIYNVPDENISKGNIRLTDGYYFVIGDNHEYSIDSRLFGPVFSEHIIGKTEIILYSYHRKKFNATRLLKIINNK